MVAKLLSLENRVYSFKCENEIMREYLDINIFEGIEDKLTLLVSENMELKKVHQEACLYEEK